MKILIADDDKAVRDCLRLILDVEGYEVIEAVDGREAFAKAQAEQPALVLMDWAMPEQDGLETLKLLKTTDATRDIPVIMITAKQEESALCEATFAGADAYLAKPFDVDVVLLVVKHFGGVSEGDEGEEAGSAAQNPDLVTEQAPQTSRELEA